MLKESATQRSWGETFKLLLEPQILTLCFLGFSAGIPFSLIFSSLSLWLNEVGFDKAVVTYFSWAGLAYSFKILWAPLIDRIPIPFLTKRLGRRRAWILIAQLMVMASIFFMGSINPADGEQALVFLAFGAVALGFSSATQDIVIDAYKVEAVDPSLQGVLSTTYFFGYRSAMIVSGAGSLFLADYLGSTKQSYLYDAWQQTYYIMALTMIVGIVTTLLISEPARTQKLQNEYTRSQYLRFICLFVVCVIALVTTAITSAEFFDSIKIPISDFLGNKVLGNFIGATAQLTTACIVAVICAFALNKMGFVEHQLVKENYYDPVRDFFQRYGKKLSILLLLFIGFYRISDIVLGVIANVFYQDMGFSKTEIAAASKTFGVAMMMLGTLIGGVFSIRFGVIRILMLGGILIVLTNLLFMWLAFVGYNPTILYVVISADNIAAGVATAAFLAFLASITNVSFTAVQYAIFSSLMTLIPKLIGGYSGSMVQNLGYSNFFLLVSLMGVPVLFLVVLLKKHLVLEEKERNS